MQGLYKCSRTIVVHNKVPLPGGNEIKPPVGAVSSAGVGPGSQSQSVVGVMG